MLNRTKDFMRVDVRALAGSRISKIVEGRFVQTIVLTSPKREVGLDASTAASQQRCLHHRKIRPSAAGFNPNSKTKVEPIGGGN